jgi:hypothetical protein
MERTPVTKPKTILIPAHLRAAASKGGQATKRYHMHHTTQLRKNLPGLLARISDPTIAPGDLDPIEAYARDYRNDLVSDAGGETAITQAQRSLIGVIVGSQLIVATIDQYLMQLAQREGLINRQKRQLHRIVEQRMQMANGLVMQLDKLGLGKRVKPRMSLDEYVAQKYGNGNGDAPAETAPEVVLEHQEP